MDRIVPPITIHQPAFITPAAPHYHHEERKRQHEERRQHEESDESEDPDGAPNAPGDDEGSIGSTIDIQI